MGGKNIKELAIKSPKRYKIAVAIAKGLNQQKSMKEIFLSLGINPSTGYSVNTQLRKEIAEMRQLQTDEKNETTGKLLAKKLLEDATPEAAQGLIDLMKDEKTPKRERRQAMKDILDLSQIKETTPPPPDISKRMQAIIMTIFAEQGGIPGEDGSEKPVIDLPNSEEDSLEDG